MRFFKLLSLFLVVLLFVLWGCDYAQLEEPEKEYQKFYYSVAIRVKNGENGHTISGARVVTSGHGLGTKTTNSSGIAKFSTYDTLEPIYAPSRLGLPATVSAAGYISWNGTIYMNDNQNYDIVDVALRHN